MIQSSIAGQTLFRLSVCLIGFVMATGAAQEQNQSVDTKAITENPVELQDKGTGISERRRLESVVWNPATCELTWIVSKGSESAGVYTPTARMTYLIRMDSAIMESNSEGRRFSQAEAENVHILMNILTRYTIESTIWWEMGRGEKLDGPKTPGPPSDENHPAPAPFKLPSRPARLDRPPAQNGSVKLSR